MLRDCCTRLSLKKGQVEIKRQVENKKQSSLWSGVQQWGAGVFCVLFLIYSQKTARQIDDNGKTFPLLQETQRREKNPTNRKK